MPLKPYMHDKRLINICFRRQKLVYNLEMSLPTCISSVPVPLQTCRSSVNRLSLLQSYGILFLNDIIEKKLLIRPGVKTIPRLTICAAQLLISLVVRCTCTCQIGAAAASPAH